MVEPVTTLTAGAIAVLVATKAFEKTGEKLGEGVCTLVDRFLTHLRRKAPATAEAIAAVAEKPELAQQQPALYGAPALSGQVETAIASDKELQAICEAIRSAVREQPGTMANLTKLADKIGVVNIGHVENQNNTINL